jgi:cell division protein FtsB
MEEITKLLSNFGFPIVLAGYLLLRFEKILETLESTNSKLVDKNDSLVSKVDGLKKTIGLLTDIIKDFKQKNG